MNRSNPKTNRSSLYEELDALPKAVVSIVPTQPKLSQQIGERASGGSANSIGIPGGCRHQYVDRTTVLRETYAHSANKIIKGEVCTCCYNVRLTEVDEN